MTSWFPWVGSVLTACCSSEIISTSEISNSGIISTSEFSSSESLFEDCQEVARTLGLQCEHVKFNKSLCKLLATTYSSSLHNFLPVSGPVYEKVVVELRRVMLCGKTLVDQCKDENWWRSVIFSSDSASMGKRVLLHLNEFRLYVKILKLVAESRGAPDGTFIGLVILDSLTPDVNDASQMDIESLRSDLESYTTMSCPQGDVTKLAEDVLRKLRATDSDHGYLHSIVYDDVKLEGYLGKGSFASVFKCEFLGVKAAAKVFRTSSSTTPRSTWVAAVQREAELQARLRHPNVVQFIGYAASEKQHIIVSELMSKNLRNYLDENILEGQTRPPLSLLLAVDIMLQIGEGMKYLHQSGMMHRDLKATNILINVVESKELCISPSVQVKLTDFGFSKLKEATNSTMFTSKETGATLWRAPEVFKQNTEKYTKAADVYSYAMVFFEVLTGKMPWCDAQGNPTILVTSELLPSIHSEKRPSLPPENYCPAHLSTFINKCWATRAEDRPKFPEICEFLWQCKGQILTCSHAYPSPQSSTPQKCTNGGG
ncbi:hypothetical protein BDL97_10G009600 [Sphagnum fallax]|nr:hypothetical protein BDL97_10G009600 [Sphagnum fallax]